MQSRRRNKYGNKPAWRDGQRFDSQAEARRYDELKLLERGGLLSDLVCQPEFVLRAEGGKRVGRYIADFSYLNEHGQHVVEDVKGVETALFKLKKKFVEAQYGIEVQLIRKK